MTAQERAREIEYDLDNLPNYLTVIDILIPHIEDAEREAWNAAIGQAAQRAATVINGYSGDVQDAIRKLTK